MDRRTIVVAALIALGAAIVSTPAESHPKKLRSEGCLAVGTHAVAVGGIRPWDCRYIATGPSVYVATTTNPFVVSVWDEARQRWNDVVRRSTPGAPTSGRLATKAGDLVAVSISCWDYTVNHWCRDAVGGRYGVIAAHSEL